MFEYFYLVTCFYFPNLFKNVTLLNESLVNLSIYLNETNTTVDNLIEFLRNNTMNESIMSY